MDPRLLRLYSDELSHLREVGAEFAREFPKIAARLGVEGMEVTDPYVERLLEGFAFLTARVQLKLEAEHPRLIAHLLEAIYPHFLAPLPSMLVARFGVDPADPNLVRGHAVPRGSALFSEIARGQDTHCEFRTAHEVMLWPIELASVQYFSFAPDLAAAKLPQLARHARRPAHPPALRRRPALRPARRSTACRSTSAPPTTSRSGSTSSCSAPPAGRSCAATRRAAPASPARRSGAAARACGRWASATTKRCCPNRCAAFSGYRLLQEVAAMPQRLLFFEVGDLPSACAAVASDEVEIVVLLKRGDAALEAVVDAGSLALFCTPAINLFTKRLDRIQVGPARGSTTSSPTAPGRWTSRCTASSRSPASAPAAWRSSGSSRSTRRITTKRRRPKARRTATTRCDASRACSRRASARTGARSSYVGEEVFLSLVDPRHAPYRDDVRQLSVTRVDTNRDLPTLLPVASANRARRRGGSSRPGRWDVSTCCAARRGRSRRRPVGQLGWRLVSHLTLNHLALVGETPQHAAAALRTMLGLYAPPDDSGRARQIEGVHRLEARSVVRRLPFKGPLTFGTRRRDRPRARRARVPGHERVPVRRRPRALLRASRLDQQLHRAHAARRRSAATVMRWPPRIGMREAL